MTKSSCPSTIDQQPVLRRTRTPDNLAQYPIPLLLHHLQYLALYISCLPALPAQITSTSRLFDITKDCLFTVPDCTSQAELTSTSKCTTSTLCAITYNAERIPHPIWQQHHANRVACSGKQISLLFLLIVTRLSQFSFPHARPTPCPVILTASLTMLLRVMEDNTILLTLFPIAANRE